MKHRNSAAKDKNIEKIEAENKHDANNENSTTTGTNAVAAIAFAMSPRKFLRYHTKVLLPQEPSELWLSLDFAEKNNNHSQLTLGTEGG